MKSFLRPFFLAAALAAVTHASAADRWTSDETAVRMGVNAWFTLWTRPAAHPADLEVKNLYATSPSALLPAVVQAASRAGLQPSAMSQPQLFAVNLRGDRAVSTFQLQPRTAEISANPPPQVVLTWERRSGVWRIIQETITPAPDAGKDVALAEPDHK